MSAATQDLIPTQTTDAEFRAWGSALSAQLAAIGLVQTGDTGQINWSTVLKPAAANASQGFEIWRFADTLQATLPVFIKIEYGASTAGAAVPGIFVTVGTGTNGAGALTGQVGARRQLTIGTNSATAFKCLFSGSTSRIGVMMFTPGASTNCFGFFVERTKDAAGADTSAGIIVHTTTASGGSGSFYSQCIPASGTIPSEETSGAALPPTMGTTGLNGADVTTYPTYTFKDFVAQNPGKNVLGYFKADTTTGVTVPVTIYGAAHTYYPLGLGHPIARGTFTNTVFSMMMRYE